MRIKHEWTLKSRVLLHTTPVESCFPKQSAMTEGHGETKLTVSCGASHLVLDARRHVIKSITWWADTPIHIMKQLVHHTECLQRKWDVPLLFQVKLSPFSQYSLSNPSSPLSTYGPLTLLLPHQPFLLEFARTKLTSWSFPAKHAGPLPGQQQPIARQAQMSLQWRHRLHTPDCEPLRPSPFGEVPVFQHLQFPLDLLTAPKGTNNKVNKRVDKQITTCNLKRK